MKICLILTISWLQFQPLFLLNNIDRRFFKHNTSVIKNNIHWDTLRSIRLAGPLYNGKTYKLIDVRDYYNFNEKIILLRNGISIDSIILPARPAQNFGVDTLESNSKGFDFSIEYGSRFYYYKQFYFKFADSQFYLVKVRTGVLDGREPSVYKERRKWIAPKVPFNKVKITNYMDD